MLATRERFGIATATQVDIPDVAHPGMLVLVHELEELDAAGLPVIQISALNFRDEAIDGTIRSDSLVPRATVIDVSDDSEIGTVDNLFSFPISIPAYGARFLILKRGDVTAP